MPIREVRFEYSSERYKAFRDASGKAVVTGPQEVKIIRNGKPCVETVSNALIEAEGIVSLGAAKLIEKEAEWKKQDEEAALKGKLHREKLDDICSGLPEPIAKALQQYAYERGHSSGHHEVEAVCEELVDMLEPALRECKVIQ